MSEGNIKLSLYDWRIAIDGLQVSVGVAEITPNDSEAGFHAKEIRRIALGPNEGGSLMEKISQTQRGAEQWIKSYYKTQEIQDKLNLENLGTIRENL